MPPSDPPQPPSRPVHSAEEPHIGCFQGRDTGCTAPRVAPCTLAKTVAAKTDSAALLLGQGSAAGASPSACLSSQPVILLLLQEPSSTQPYLSRLPLTQASMWQPPPARVGPQAPQQAPQAAGPDTAGDSGTTSSASQGSGSSRRATSRGAAPSSQADLQQQGQQAAGCVATAVDAGTAQGALSSRNAGSQGKQTPDRGYKDVHCLSS